VRCSTLGALLCVVALTGCVQASSVARAGGGTLPALFVVEPLDGQCVWRRYTGPSRYKDLARTAACPHDIWWQVSDTAKVVALGEDRVWTGSLRSLKWVALPHDDITELWVVDGKPMVGRIRHGDSVVVESFVLKGDSFVPGPTRTVSEAERYGGDILGRPPTGQSDKAWTSMGRTLAGAPSKKAMLDNPTDAQRALVSAGPYDDTVGMLDTGSKKLAYKGIIGDTAHPAAPLVWCSDDSCSRGTPVQGRLPTQLAVMPKDGFVLVTEEYTGRSPVVYAEGGTKPVLVLPEDARGVWLR